MVNENKQLREEIKQVKLMLKIPRIHFKNIENSDWESLKGQYEEILSKMDKFGNQNTDKREFIRAQHNI